MKLIITFIFFFGLKSLFSQDSLSLQNCADLLKKNTLLSIANRAEINQKLVTQKLHFWDLIPTVNASVNFNSIFGRQLDPVTNNFVYEPTSNQLYSLNSNVYLFRGFRYLHTTNSYKHSLEILRISEEEQYNEHLKRVITFYEILCKTQIKLEYSIKRVKLYKNIQDIQRSLFSAGRILASDTLKSYNSLLNEQLIQSSNEKELRINEIELNYLIGLPLMQHNLYDLQSIKTLQTLPHFSAHYELSKLDHEQQLINEELAIARGALLPTLSFSSNFGSRFSDAFKVDTIPGKPTIPYSNQINQNMNYMIGFNLTIPILNNGNWFKSKEIYAIKTQAYAEERQLNQINLEKEAISVEQNLLFIKAELTALEKITGNLETIYQTALNLYQNQRISYAEMENNLMEWQNKVVELACKKIEYEKLQIESKY